MHMRGLAFGKEWYHFQSRTYSQREVKHTLQRKYLAHWRYFIISRFWKDEVIEAKVSLPI